MLKTRKDVKNLKNHLGMHLIYENEAKATKLLEASKEVIHKNTRGRVTTVLADGGTALAAAVRRIGEQDAGYGR